MSQLPPPAYNPYAGESSISASALPPPVYDAHAIPVAQVAPGPIYQQPPYPTQVRAFPLSGAVRERPPQLAGKSSECVRQPRLPSFGAH